MRICITEVSLGTCEKIFTRSFKTGEADYDKKNVGWLIEELNGSLGGNVSAFERRKVYDTTLPGRGNACHTYGDDLSDYQRWAVIEYLKGL